VKKSSSRASRPSRTKAPSPSTKRPTPARRPTPPKPSPKAPKRVTATARKSPAENPPAKKTPPKRMSPRADYGAPIDAFFARQPPALAAILNALRKLVDAAAPDATSSLKWGMPFYELSGNTLCALAGFKAHVNLILPGGPGTYADPDGLLEGDGKTGRHLKVRTIDELPTKVVKGWLKTAAARARKGA
jgi:hypothetical protein